MAALLHYQIGKYIETDYYIKKVYSDESQYSKENIEIIKLIENRTRFMLGNLDREKYLLNLEVLEKEIKNELNNLFIKMEIIYLKSSDRENFDISKCPAMLTDIQNLFNHLEKIKIDEQQKKLV